MSEKTDDHRDAARYRWLRDNAAPWSQLSPIPYALIRIVMAHNERGTHSFDIIGTRDGVGIVTLDTAVDCAIAACRSPAKEST